MLFVCLTACHIPFVCSVLERSKKCTFCRSYLHASEWWCISEINALKVKGEGHWEEIYKKKSFFVIMQLISVISSGSAQPSYRFRCPPEQ